MTTPNIGTRVVVLKPGGIKNVANAVQYQRILTLSKNYSTAIVTDGLIPPRIASVSNRYHTVRRGWRFIPSAVRVVGSLWKDGFHVIYTSNQPRAIIVVFLARLLNPFMWIADIWDDPMLAFRDMRKGRMKTMLFRKFLKSVLPQADAWILGLHEGILAELPLRLNETHLLRVTNGVCLDLVVPDDIGDDVGRPLKGSLRVGYSGWVTLKRGIALLIACLERDGAFTDRIEVHVWGPAEEDAEVAINLHNRCFDQKIYYHGHVSHNESLRLLNSCDVGLCILDQSVTNFRYAYPIKLFEYMATGKVVIASDTPAIGEIIRNGQTGFLIRNTVESMCDCLEKTISLKSQNMLSGIGNSARKQAEQYDWNDINQQVMDFLEGELGFSPKYYQN